MCRTSTSTATTSPTERLRLVARMSHPLFPEPVSDVAQFSGLPTSTLYRRKQRASRQIIRKPCSLMPQVPVLNVVVSQALTLKS